MSNDYYYENALIENNGVELNLGMVGGFEFVMHAFKWEDVHGIRVMADNHYELVLIYCFIKRPNEPLEDYGSFALSINDIPKVLRAVREIKAELEQGIVFVTDPESTYIDMDPDRDWLAHGLNNYGGRLVEMEQRIISSQEDPTEYVWECIAHVHQWLERDAERKPVRYNILISDFGKNLAFPDSKYDNHDYSSILIPLDKVDEFSTLLEKFRKDMQSKWRS